MHHALAMLSHLGRFKALRTRSEKGAAFLILLWLYAWLCTILRGASISSCYCCTWYQPWKLIGMQAQHSSLHVYARLCVYIYIYIYYIRTILNQPASQPAMTASHRNIHTYPLRKHVYRWAPWLPCISWRALYMQAFGLKSLNKMCET